jgi:hypothetical protein
MQRNLDNAWHEIRLMVGLAPSCYFDVHLKQMGRDLLHAFLLEHAEPAKQATTQLCDVPVAGRASWLGRIGWPMDVSTSS